MSGSVDSVSNSPSTNPSNETNRPVDPSSYRYYHQVNIPDEVLREMAEKHTNRHYYFSKLPNLLPLWIISFIAFYSTTIYVWILPNPYFFNTIIGLMILVVGHVFVALFLWSLVALLTCKSSFVPKNWRPTDVEESLLETIKTEALEQSLHPINYRKPRFSNQIRYCTYCEAYKPARSHHCQLCRS